MSSVYKTVCVLYLRTCWYSLVSVLCECVCTVRVCLYCVSVSVLWECVCTVSICTVRVCLYCVSVSVLCDNWVQVMAAVNNLCEDEWLVILVFACVCTVWVCLYCVSVSVLCDDWALVMATICVEMTGWQMPSFMAHIRHGFRSFYLQIQGLKTRPGWWISGKIDALAGY